MNCDSVIKNEDYDTYVLETRKMWLEYDYSL